MAGKRNRGRVVTPLSSIAKERGIEKVMGTVLAENTQMLALGKKLGFKINKVVGAGEYRVEHRFSDKLIVGRGFFSLSF